MWKRKRSVLSFSIDQIDGSKNQVMLGLSYNHDKHTKKKKFFFIVIFLIAPTQWRRKICMNIVHPPEEPMMNNWIWIH